MRAPGPVFATRLSAAGLLRRWSHACVRARLPRVRGLSGFGGGELVQRSLHSRGLRLIATATRALGVTDRERRDDDPDGLGVIARTFVWARWSTLSIGLVLLAVYRPEDWPETYAAYAPGISLFVALNGYMHYRLATKQTVTRGWIVASATLDVFLLSVGVALKGGFSDYLYLFYYSQLAGYAVILTSFWLTMACATFVTLLYLAVGLTFGDGIDTATGEDEFLVVRVFVMYQVAAIVNIIARFERGRWRHAVERERDLQRERVEFSQAIHDTTAQSAYMVRLGIDTARVQAGDANPELAATLDATSRLSRSAIWDLRHPIHMGDIYEGGGLSSALRSHATSFTNVTAVPCELTQTGAEPPLSTEARGLLFSIAHNALTNAYRHAEASRVAIHLACGDDETRLSVLDDGVGLPADYAQRGHGFDNMHGGARRLGGRLAVEPRGAMGGTTVTCVIPQKRR